MTKYEQKGEDIRKAAGLDARPSWYCECIDCGHAYWPLNYDEGEEHHFEGECVKCPLCGGRQIEAIDLDAMLAAEANPTPIEVAESCEKCGGILSTTGNGFGGGLTGSDVWHQRCRCKDRFARLPKAGRL
jgi:hypothetical protein